MTKSELKQIIKSLIVESINESTPKGFPQKIKKKVLKQYGKSKEGKAKAYATMQKIAKNLDEQEEMDELPIDPQASAEPDAGAVEGPEVPETAEEGEHADLLAQIDNIQQALDSLKASLQGHAQGEEETGEEEVGGEPEAEQV